MNNTYQADGKLFVISGPSGTGKGSICKEVIKDHRVDISISMTTRSPRKGEVNGKDYFFVTKDEFNNNIKKGNLLEYAEVYDNMYGTPKDTVMKKLAQKRNIILEIDIQGGLQVKEAFPDSILIFILPPSYSELNRRIKDRGTDSEEVIRKRMAQTANEIKLIGEYDYYVVNNDFDEAVRDVKSIFTAENSRVPERVKPLIKEYEEAK